MPCYGSVARRARAGAGGESGFATVEYVAAVGLSLVLLVLVANFVVVQYAQGVLRAAVDEAVRDGARVFRGDDEATVEARCVHRAREVLGNLLNGGMGHGLSVACTATPTEVRASIEGRFEGWLPGVPDVDATTRGIATREQL